MPKPRLIISRYGTGDKKVYLFKTIPSAQYKELGEQQLLDYIRDRISTEALNMKPQYDTENLSNEEIALFEGIRSNRLTLDKKV
jgi:hypothetical protein